MKIAELKTLIRDLPDEAEIKPEWATGPPGDSDPAVVLRGFRIGTEGSKPCLDVLVDLQHLGEEDNDDLEGSEAVLTVCEKCGHQGTGKEFRDPVDQMPCTCCPKCKSRDVYTTD
jgi:predicted Zn-ribbon and HTH transcriptional regulator